MHRSGCVVRWLLSVVFVVPIVLRGEDWPQWLGPKRDSVWREEGILQSFPAGGPKIVWRQPIAGGYSGPAVAAGKVYVMDYVMKGGTSTLDFNNRDKIEGQERVRCLDAATGAEVWNHSYPCTYNISYATGPRCTAAVADGKVYALGAEGHLWCLNATSGKVVWSRALKSDYKVETPLWGFCGHPLVDDKRLICLVGGEGSIAVAFDKDTGKELWRSLKAREPGYCAPTLIETGGTRQLLIWHAESINSLDPQSGKVHWSVPLAPSFGMAIAVPRLLNNVLFAGGIRNECVALQLASDRPAAKEMWRGNPKTGLYSANCMPFVQDDMIYGCDCNSGHFRGVRLSTGERLWETLLPTAGGEQRASHGTAFIVKNADRFFLLSETGDLIIAKLSPEGYDEISRAKLLEPTSTAFGRKVVWSHPAFANRCIYARNDKEIVCASLAEK
jgi:outer membrane protein assembly factor BamB